MHLVLSYLTLALLVAPFVAPLALALAAALTALAATGRPRDEFVLGIIGKGTVVISSYITLVAFDRLSMLEDYVLAGGVLGICHKVAREVNEVVVKRDDSLGSGLLITLSLYTGAAGICICLGDLPIPYLLGEIVNGVILTPLRVMRKRSPEGRLWGLWGTLAYTVPYISAGALLLLADKPEGIAALTLVSAALGVLPCWAWIAKNEGLKPPKVSVIRQVIAEALPGIAAEAPGFLARSLSTLVLAAMASSEAALWAKFGAFLACIWDIVSQMQVVGADRLTRARRDGRGEAEAERQFWRLLWWSVVTWIAFGAILAPAYGLPTIWVLVTLPKLASSLGTRHLEAKGLRAELAVCTAANYVAACIPLFFMSGISALVGAEIAGGLVSCLIGVWYLKKRC